ncbi:MAG: BTAD domain-containing putative transcriptional regulator [Chloroflexi bacterium]|nr:BTAD domain-containing putative transcriptional regulator [Chloroflexota bacterium]
MADLSLRFLGQFQVMRDERPVTTFESDKVRALLAYLAVEAERVHARSTLTTLLWPDYDESSARTNLRQALYQLRKVIGDGDGSPARLIITRQSLQFNLATAYNLDVITFSRLLQQCASHPHERLEQCSVCLPQLRQAVDLYQGDFLAGFTLDDSAPFEEWRLVKQEHFHLQALDTLALLADVDEATGELERAQRYTRRQLVLEPWREEAHRQLMRLLARQGQRATALAQYQTCRQVLAAELGIEPSEATSTLYDQIRTGAFPDKTTGRRAQRVSEFSQTGAGDKAIRSEESKENAPSKLFLSPALPTQLTPFVGRERELAEIIAQLQQAQAPLLTLAGPGGMGKTRLALEAARTIATYEAHQTPEQTRDQRDTRSPPRFPDGLFFVGLAALNAATALASTIAATLALPLDGGDPEQALLNFLSTRRLLLILDNFEQLLDGVAFIVKILQMAPGVQLVITSRERLNIQGEQLYLVQEMDYSLQASLQDAANSSAVRLFIQRAQRAQTNFQLNAINLPAILRICQLVRGMPLGLELAASWVGILSLPEIAEEIEKSVDFLAIDWRNVPDRQRSMRAVFAWSWQLLTADEQQVFRKLALFRGGFTREAGEQVADATLRVLTALVHKSLVRRVESSVTQTSARYEVHELLRQFAAEQLIMAEAEHEQAARHSAFYLNFVAAREQRLVRTEPREAAAEIQADLDNIRQAWVWAIQQLDTRALDRSAWSLRAFYDTIGALSEGVQVFQLANQPLPGLGQPDGHIAPDQQHDLSVLSKLSAIHANLLMTQGKYTQAITVAQQAIARVEAYGASEAAALSHLSWGQALHRQGHFGDAQEHFEQALQLVYAVQTHAVQSELLYDIECTTQLWLGGLNTDLGFYQTARGYISRSLRLAQAQSKRRMEMTCLINLANLARRAGDYPAARRDYESALRFTPQIGYRWGEATIHLELGDVVRLQGEYGLACALIKKAFTMFQEIGAHDPEALAAAWLSRIYAYVGDYPQEAEWLAHYLRAECKGRGREAEINYLHAQTVLAFQQRNYAQVLAYASQTWQLGQAFGPQDAWAYALILTGHAHTRLQQFAAATAAYQQAMHLYIELDRADLAAEAQAGLAEIAEQQGDGSQAQTLVEALLKQLIEHPSMGQDEPFYVYFTCYQILAAHQDPRAATILVQGHTRLQQYADQLTDATLRQTFLEIVPVHRALHQAYTQSYPVAALTI